MTPLQVGPGTGRQRCSWRLTSKLQALVACTSWSQLDATPTILTTYRNTGVPVVRQHTYVPPHLLITCVYYFPCVSESCAVPPCKGLGRLGAVGALSVVLRPTRLNERVGAVSVIVLPFKGRLGAVAGDSILRIHRNISRIKRKMTSQGSSREHAATCNQVRPWVYLKNRTVTGIPLVNGALSLL